jgi:hypothetical protein
MTADVGKDENFKHLGVPDADHASKLEWPQKLHSGKAVP